VFAWDQKHRPHPVVVVGLGSRQCWKEGALMTSSYSANCDETFLIKPKKGICGLPVDTFLRFRRETPMFMYQS